MMQHRKWFFAFTAIVLVLMIVSVGTTGAATQLQNGAFSQQTDSTATPQSSEEIQVTTVSSVNLRAEASTQSEIVDSLVEDFRLMVIEEVVGESLTIGDITTDVWYHVSYACGENEGFVWSGLVEVDETVETTATTWSLNSPFCEDMLPDDIKERLKEHEGLAVWIPTTGVIVDYSAATELVGYVWTYDQLNITDFQLVDIQINPAPILLQNLQNVILPFLLQVISDDTDYSIAVLTEDGQITRISIDPNNLPITIIEIRDLSNYGSDMAPYVGNVSALELRTATRQFTVQFKNVRLISPEGYLVVRAYQPDDADPWSGTQDFTVVHALSFGYSDSEELLSNDTWLAYVDVHINGEIVEGRTGLIVSRSELDFLEANRVDN